MSLVEDTFSFFNSLTPFKTTDGGGFEPSSPDKVNSPDMGSPFSFVNALEEKDPIPNVAFSLLQQPMQQKVPQEANMVDLLEQYKQQLILQQQQQQLQQLQQLQQIQQFQFQQNPQAQLQQKLQAQLKLQQTGYPVNDFFFQPNQTLIPNTQAFYPTFQPTAPIAPQTSGLLSKLVPTPLLTLVSGAGVTKSVPTTNNTLPYQMVGVPQQPQQQQQLPQAAAPVPQQQPQPQQNSSNSSSSASSPNTSVEGVSSPETDNCSTTAPKKPVTAASARKDRLKRRRDQKTTKSGKDSSSSGEEKTSVEKENDLKRQRRLIKNRESAQASRERKKIYVQNLEESVNVLSSKNTDLSQKIGNLEEENRILKEQLLQLTQAKLPSSLPILETLERDEDEPNAKKRRISDNNSCPMSSVQGSLKLPLPKNASAQNGYLVSFNPFNSTFWSSLLGMNQTSAMQQVQTLVGQPTVVPVQQQSVSMNGENVVIQPALADASASMWSISPQTKGVILFVILFCVGMLFGFPESKIEKEPFSNYSERKSTPKQKVGRTLKTTFFEEDQQQLFEKFSEEKVKLQKNSPLAKISPFLWFDKNNGKEAAENFEDKLKVQFGDVSHDHSKKYFSFKVSVSDPALKNTEPLAVTVSPSFQVFARRPSQNGKNEKPRSNILFSDIKMENKEVNEEKSIDKDGGVEIEVIIPEEILRVVDTSNNKLGALKSLINMIASTKNEQIHSYAEKEELDNYIKEKLNLGNNFNVVSNSSNSLVGDENVDFSPFSTMATSTEEATSKAQDSVYLVFKHFPNVDLN